MVDLLASYSNHHDLSRRIGALLMDIEADDQRNAPGVPARPRSWSLRDRLSAQDVQELVDLFMAGISKAQLATKFGISLTSVKRLLRQQGVRRGAKWHG
jgi:DNA invertase Pin-like site-specific DNA recombinase